MKKIEERAKQKIETYLDQGEARQYVLGLGYVDDYATFEERVWEDFDENLDYAQRYLVDEMIKEGYDADEAFDAVCDYGERIYPTEDLLNENVHVDLVLHFGDDLNKDYGNDANDWLIALLDSQGFDGKNHCLYRFQNDDVPLTEKEYDEVVENKFLFSLLEEITNQTHIMAALTVIGKIPLRDYFKLISGDKYEIEITKSAMLGLFNPWLGGGSVLGIELSKSFTITNENVNAVYVNDTSDYGYSVQDVYGLTDACWDEDALKVKQKED